MIELKNEISLLIHTAVKSWNQIEKFTIMKVVDATELL